MKHAAGTHCEGVLVNVLVQALLHPCWLLSLIQILLSWRFLCRSDTFMDQYMTRCRSFTSSHIANQAFSVQLNLCILYASLETLMLLTTANMNIANQVKHRHHCVKL